LTLNSKLFTLNNKEDLTMTKVITFLFNYLGEVHRPGTIRSSLRKKVAYRRAERERKVLKGIA
jgi:hypothetical protein